MKRRQAWRTCCRRPGVRGPGRAYGVRCLHCVHARGGAGRCIKCRPAHACGACPADGRGGCAKPCTVHPPIPSQRTACTCSEYPVACNCTGRPVACTCSGSPLARTCTGRPVACTCSECPVACTCTGRPLARTCTECPVACTCSECPVARTCTGRPEACAVMAVSLTIGPPSAGRSTAAAQVQGRHHQVRAGMARRGVRMQAGGAASLPASHPQARHAHAQARPDGAW